MVNWLKMPSEVIVFVHTFLNLHNLSGWFSIFSNNKSVMKSQSIVEGKL